jgi:hypothetical protein
MRVLRFKSDGNITREMSWNSMSTKSFVPDVVDVESYRFPGMPEPPRKFENTNDTSCWMRTEWPIHKALTRQIARSQLLFLLCLYPLYTTDSCHKAIHKKTLMPLSWNALGSKRNGSCPEATMNEHNKHLFARPHHCCYTILALKNESRRAPSMSTTDHKNANSVVRCRSTPIKGLVRDRLDYSLPFLGTY